MLKNFFWIRSRKILIVFICGQLQISHSFAQAGKWEIEATLLLGAITGEYKIKKNEGKRYISSLFSLFTAGSGLEVNPYYYLDEALIIDIPVLWVRSSYGNDSKNIFLDAGLGVGYLLGKSKISIGGFSGWYENIDKVENVHVEDKFNGHGIYVSFSYKVYRSLCLSYKVKKATNMDLMTSVYGVGIRLP